MNSYWNAMALNNTGVKLLKEYQALESIQILRRAIETMKSAIDLADGTLSSMCHGRPTSRYAEPTICQVDKKKIVIDLLCLDANGLILPDRATLSHPPSLVYRPVVMDCCGCSDSGTPFYPKNPVLECSVILYNLGVANQLAAKVHFANANAQQKKYQTNAVRVMELAFTLISKQSENIDCTNDSVDAAILLQLGLYMTACIAQTHHEQGLLQEAHHASVRCSRIADALTSIGFDILKGYSVSAAAAA